MKLWHIVINGLVTFKKALWKNNKKEPRKNLQIFVKSKEGNLNAKFGKKIAGLFHENVYFKMKLHF
jgi:hypothetical protein